MTNYFHKQISALKKGRVRLCSLVVGAGAAQEVRGRGLTCAKKPFLERRAYRKRFHSRATNCCLFRLQPFTWKEPFPSEPLSQSVSRDSAARQGSGVRGHRSEGATKTTADRLQSLNLLSLLVFSKRKKKKLIFSWTWCRVDLCVCGVSLCVVCIIIVCISSVPDRNRDTE